MLVLLPLLPHQAAGVRRPIRSERLVGLLSEWGLVSCTPSPPSRPALNVLFNNQGLVKESFEPVSDWFAWLSRP
jgi:hypothetical protein